MDLLENISGNRVHYSTNILGGVKFDLDDEKIAAIRKGMDYLEERTKYYMDVVTTDSTFLGRTSGVGVMTHEQAETLGAVGPTVRASGVRRDVRIDSPYAAYNEFPARLITDERGDLLARFVVRLNELLDAYRIIREVMDHLPAGELSVRVPRKIPAGETISRVEAPRGELLYFVRSSGGETPERVKARTPSLCNWGSVSAVAVGHKLADMPMLLVGIDPCFSCNDRRVTIRRPGETQDWTWENLRMYGVNVTDEHHLSPCPGSVDFSWRVGLACRWLAV